MSPKMFYLNRDWGEGADGLTEWLVLELAATLCGNKPSTVLSLTDTKFMPLFTLWRQYGEEILQDSNLSYFILRETQKSVTVLFYRRDRLEECIQENDHRTFLQQCGYPVRKGLDACLKVLRTRFQRTCPHEVGLLLGIPLKDVLGFMGLNQLSLTCRGMWHIYGDPECSLSAMRCFKNDRQRVEEHMRQGVAPARLLCV
ncbi:MAG TPA: DUF3793 domain-containing protein [Firmicutes bacterium]|nr:DUF3793 domain-containing protein [Bacillota bacterium]